VLLSLILVWEARKRPEIISWIGLTAGLAVMTKSWAGFAAFGLPLIYSVALRQFGKQFRYWVFAILLLAAVILPWHVWQLWINGLPFIHDYFVVNVFGRMFGLVQQETRGPFFYLDILHRGFPVFAYAAVCALVWAIWTLPKKDHPQKLLLLTWIVVPLLVFSMAKTKLGWYIILIYPAVAILIAQAVSELAGERLALGATAAAMALLSFRLPVPTNASLDLKLFAAETRQIVGSADPLYVYSQEPCSTPGTMVAYDQSGIFSIPPSLVYYLNRKLSCTNAARPSELPLGSYVVADLKLLAEAETFDHIILQRGRFVLGTSTARNQRGGCNDEMGRCRRDESNSLTNTDLNDLRTRGARH
jgi:hypothetical protein